MSSDIVLRGASEHNLKGIDVTIPRDRLVVITGLSGSGKSSLAFDTIYAEGQRRYVESLSAYARQFLGTLEKPQVESIEGLSPAISIEQRSGGANPRSTVGTVTEIYDYLRLLFARVGTPHCPRCGEPITRQTVDQMVDRVLAFGAGTRVQVLASLVRGRKGEHRAVLDTARREGFVRVRVDGQLMDLDDVPALRKTQKHDIDVVVDRLVVGEGATGRLADSLSTALRLGGGVVRVAGAGRADLVMSELLACFRCGVSVEELSPRMFSFNSPYGACPACGGLGTTRTVDPDLVVPDRSLAISAGALLPWASPSQKIVQAQLEAVSRHYGLDLGLPFERLPARQQEILLYGSRGEEILVRYRGSRFRGEIRTPFEGVIGWMERRFRESSSEKVRAWVEEYMSLKVCSSCQGSRLRPESRAVTVGGITVDQLCALAVGKTREFFRQLRLEGVRAQVSEPILKEIRDRLDFLCGVGLEYLTLDRSATSLSGGEAQRIRLATQIGSRLVGVIYILDEPSIGLHNRDHRRLLATLQRLRDMGNTVLVVEHDRDTILAADWVIDLGPGAGAAGGELVAAGPPAAIMASAASLTGQYLSGQRQIQVPRSRRQGHGAALEVCGARENNLRGIDVAFPLGRFICVTGVSGSGKSTLLLDVLHRALARHFYGAREPVGKHSHLRGLEHIDKVVVIDQSPLGRSPRSNPATYTGLFTDVRTLMSELAEARLRGYGPGRFSFNVKGGRCEACEGDGIRRIEMHFLPDVFVRCEECLGKRYNRETLEVRYRGKNIADMLDMTVEEAREFFAAFPRVRSFLTTLADVGLGYIKLGQPATTLSGGEAQRVKLATELSRRATGRTLYILDEPTTGLHFEDIRHLLAVLNRLVDAGNTVVVIEHNLDVVKCADYVIDLGPEGGEAGGLVVATGTPEEVARTRGSYTGQALAPLLRPAPRGRGASPAGGTPAKRALAVGGTIREE